VVTDDRARCDAREKIKALSFPWLHSQHQIWEEKTVMRVFEEAFNQLAIHDMESWSSNETAGNTGVALQGLAKIV